MPVHPSRQQRISLPVAVSTVNQTANAVTNIRHSEYLGKLSDNGLTTYVIQPGFSTTFPWLSQIANAFETYVIKSLRVRLTPLSSTNINGCIAAVFDYDSADPAPSTFAHLNNMAGAI